MFESFGISERENSQSVTAEFADRRVEQDPGRVDPAPLHTGARELGERPVDLHAFPTSIGALFLQSSSPAFPSVT